MAAPAWWGAARNVEALIMLARIAVVLVIATGAAMQVEAPVKDPITELPEGHIKRMLIRVESPGFKPNEPIPRKYTGDGEDVSPEIRWSGIPKDARQLALICDDPDAPSPQPWVHWVIYQIPVGSTGLAENTPRKEKLETPIDAVQGKNSWGAVGYRGPAPPQGHGVHHYHFRIYALDKPLTLGPGKTKSELLAAMKGHILAEGELVGTYQR